MNSRLQKLFLFFLFFPLRIIDFFLPRRDDIWIFGSWKGSKYNDNSRALFEYVNEHQKDIQAIWITKNKEIERLLKNKGYRVYHNLSLRGIYYSFRAGVVVITVGYSDVGIFPFIFPHRIKIIELWHGTPIKRLDVNFFSRRENMVLSLTNKYFGRPFDLIISACQSNKEKYAEVFSVNPEAVRITGQPRNDRLFKTSQEKKEKKLILYLPTWREYDPLYDLFFQYKFDIRRIDKFMEEINASFFIKFHSNESGKNIFFENCKSAENIKFWEGDDIYEFLSRVDVLITDYSSVYLDFLILDRPMIFTPFDLDNYTKKRGFYYNYEEITPGPKTKDWLDVERKISEIMTNDAYIEDRRRVNAIFNYWSDGRSCERVFNEIIKIL